MNKMQIPVVVIYFKKNNPNLTNIAGKQFFS